MSHVFRIFLALLFFAPFIASSDVRPSGGVPTSARSIKSVASFQFCFEIPHGRCFNTTATGRLRQVGGRSPSQASVEEKRMLALEAEIADFVKATFSAAPRKPRSCQQAVVYRSFEPRTLELKVEAKRCLEFLNKTNTLKLAKLVDKLSLATKPR